VTDVKYMYDVFY